MARVARVSQVKELGRDTVMCCLQTMEDTLTAGPSVFHVLAHALRTRAAASITCFALTVGAVAATPVRRAACAASSSGARATRRR